MLARFYQFLADELRATPGRGNFTLRLTLSCAAVISLFMWLQIPFLPVALIVVFYTSQSNVLMIKLVGIVFFITISISLGCALLIIKFTYDYPFLRLVASSGLFFSAIYLMRILGKLGMAFFVVALVVIYAQTFPSMTSEAELLVRLLLWLWVAVNGAILITLAVNACFSQAFPGYQFKSQLRHMLCQVSVALQAVGRGENASCAPTLCDVARQCSRLQTLLAFSCRTDWEVKRSSAAYRALSAFSMRVYHLAALSGPSIVRNDADGALALRLSRVISTLAMHLTVTDIDPADIAAIRDTPANSAILQDIGRMLIRLNEGDVIPLPAGQAEKEPIISADAFSNPAYARFALKTLLATLICYLFYTATAWQGIHTIMLSCVIVAQPSLGATMQKTMLRILGALVATLLALFMMIVVQPLVDSLPGLLLMSLPVLALGAWLAGGSPRIAYAGIQIGFTFSLAFLEGFGPMYNLSELRDRVVGILLGVAVSSIIHLYLWPDTEAPRLKTHLIRLYRQIAAHLSQRTQGVSSQALLQSLLKTDAMIDRVFAEPLHTHTHPSSEARMWPAHDTFAVAQDILRHGEGYRLYCHDEPDIFLVQCAQRLSDYANRLEQRRPVTAQPAAVSSAAAGNPFAAPLAAAMTALPEWPPENHSTRQQAD